jgi:hypothetical protein
MASLVASAQAGDSLLQTLPLWRSTLLFCQLWGVNRGECEVITGGHNVDEAVDGDGEAVVLANLPKLMGHRDHQTIWMSCWKEMETLQ